MLLEVTRNLKHLISWKFVNKLEIILNIILSFMDLCLPLKYTRFFLQAT